ncbi:MULTISPECIES: alpha/beta hydrolase [unclassified Luteimonas]
MQPGRDGREHLVFAHANGFPGEVYRELFDAWRTRFAVSAVARFGHGADYPVAPRWPGLARQLVDHIQAQVDPGDRLWLVGHSLGGYVSTLAAAALGDRVAGVVLLDSPLICGFSAQLVRCGRQLGFDRYMMPIRQTRRRRQTWPDVDAVHAHFAARASFARWEPRTLRHYAEHGTLARDDGSRVLAFDRDIELAIYRSLPTMTVVSAARSALAPIGFIGGTGSREVRHVGMRATRAATQGRVAWVEGSHLFPMERPHETAVAVQSMIGTMATRQASAA